MLQKLRTNNSQGFTLIELMIVIAIIGILAAIAIPNFISYRNKSFCSRAESDANGLAQSVMDYFAIPAHVDLPAMTDLVTKVVDDAGYLSGDEPSRNTGTLESEEVDINITIAVVDGSGRCPADYRANDPVDFDSRNNGWGEDDGDNVYYKYISY